VELRADAILLRPWRKDDAEGVYAACQDPDIQRWIPVIPRPYTREDARAFVSGEPELGPYQFAIVEHTRLVGSLSLRVNESGTGHLGYWCARGARGRGIITRALRLLCRYALEDLGLERLELIADPENAASLRVAAKVGFRREGVLRSHLRHPDGHRRDSVMLSLLPGELRPSERDVAAP
jgi:RimJ/RimL family protein N-acetyltransferase